MVNPHNKKNDNQGDMTFEKRLAGVCPPESKKWSAAATDHENWHLATWIDWMLVSLSVIPITSANYTKILVLWVLPLLASVTTCSP